MLCKVCHSDNQVYFPAEINIHFPGPDNLTKATVWAFPQLLLCLDCGFTEFVLETPDLWQLRNGMASPQGSAQEREQR